MVLHIKEHIKELMMISLTHIEILETLVLQIEELIVEHLTVEKKLKNFLEPSLVEVLDKVQQVVVEVVMVDIMVVVRIVVVVIREIILMVHIQQIKVNTILF